MMYGDCFSAQAFRELFHGGVHVGSRGHVTQDPITNYIEEHITVVVIVRIFAARTVFQNDITGKTLFAAAATVWRADSTASRPG